MAAAGGGAAWMITGEDRSKHDSQFFQLRPVNGFVTGDQAKGFFMQSGLPTAMLGQIWTLADMNNDGKMDKKEFSIAMHLIKKKLQGYELPKSLPASLKADPVPPMVGSFGGMSVAGPGMMMGSKPSGVMGQAAMPVIGSMAPTAMVASPMTMPVMSNGVAPPMSQAGFGMMGMAPGMDGKPRAGSFTATPQQPMGAGQMSSFAMPHQSKLKYTQLFNTNDRNKRGSLTGVEARAIFLQTGIPQPILAQIWGLSDVDKDGKLTCDEFCIAMHLIDLVKMGVTLPPTLPPELLPTKGRSGSFGPPQVNQPQQSIPGKPKDAFEDLLGNMGMPPPQPIQPQANNATQELEEDMSQVTFEDRRKENFAKGQAELDRRRQALQDQMRREQEARMQKERQEQEKKERIRQEQEMKRQMELEKHMEKQRQNEREREEQRQKIMEQREAARRELERQRQMEWERQRKEQLLAEKRREYEQLGNLKSRSSNLKCELESQEGKKTEITQKISQVRNGVTDFTGSIESMRGKRDTKMSEIDRLQNELQLLNQNYQRVQQEREQLHIQMQTTVQSNPLSETHRTVLHSVELKKTTIQKLKKDLEQIERDTECQLQEIDNNNSDLSELNVKLKDLQNELITLQTEQTSNQQKNKQEVDNASKLKQEKLRKELEAQRLREESEKKDMPTTKSDSSSWFAFGNDNKTTTESAQDDIWSSAFSSENLKAADNKQDIWASAFSSQSTDTTLVSAESKKTKYKVLYQFDARNQDELALMPGEIIMVPEDQSGAEPGWMGGEKDGKTGWFPKDYVELVQESVPSSQFPEMNAFSGASTSTLSSVPAHVAPVESKPTAPTPPAKFVDDSSFSVVQSKPVAPSPTPGQGTAAPDGLQAQALYPWKAKKDNHLSFNKGDIITIKMQQEMWWSGELNGQIGWFPKSYVKLKGAALVGSNRSSRSQTPTLAAENVDGGGSARSTPQLSTPAPEGESYVAMYNYNSAEPGDLAFNQGDIIMITKMEGDWWTGTIGDKSGVFPANYVKKSEVQIASDSLAGNLYNTECDPPVQAVLESAVAVFDQNQGTNTSSQSLQPGFDISNSFQELSTKEMSENAKGFDFNFDPFGEDSSKRPGETNISDPFASEFTKTMGEAGFSDPFGDSSKKTPGQTSFPDPFGGETSKIPGEAAFSDTFGENSNKTPGQMSFPDPFGGEPSKISAEAAFSDQFGDSTNKTPGQTSFSDPFGGDTSKIPGEAVLSDPFGSESSKTAGQQTASDPFGGETTKTAGQTTFSDFDAFNFDSVSSPTDLTVNQGMPPSKPDEADAPPPLPPIRRKRSTAKQTKQMTGEGNPVTSLVNSDNELKSSSSPAPVFGDFGNADQFKNENSQKLDSEGKFGSPKDDAQLKDDPFSSFSASDPFAQSQKNLGTKTDPFAGEDPFANLGNNAETLSDPFAKSQNDSTDGLATGKDPFEGTDLFGNTGSTYLFGDTGVTSGTEILGGVNSQNKSNSENVGTTSDPFGGGDPFAGQENKHMTDVIAMGRNLMSPSTDQEIINAFSNLPTESATSFNLNVSTSTTDLQNNFHHTSNPTAQPTIISPDSNITETVAFPAGYISQPHVTESPEPTYEEICPPPLPSLNKIPPRPPKPPRQIQSKTVHFEPDAIYEDLPNEFWTQGLRDTKDQPDKDELECGNLSDNPLSSSTPQECVEEPFGGDFLAATGNTDQTETKMGQEETYDDATVGGFVADFDSMTTSSSEAVDIPGQYENVPELSSKNTGQSTPAFTSPPKPNSSGKNKKKGKSWVNKYMKKITSSSTSKQAKDVPDSGLYEEPVKSADKKTDPLTASTSKPQPLEMGQLESELYEEINVAWPTSGVQTSPGTGVVSGIVPEPAPASTTQSKSGSLPLKKPEIASVIASYTATGPEQLSLQPGQLIQVRKKSPSGWWEGELQARGQKRKIGWFPANYVKLLGTSSKPSTPDTTLQAQSGSSSPASSINRTNTPTIPPPQLGSQPTQPEVKYIDQVVALYPYIAQNDDELTFHNGSVINVISKDDANWWSGECNGQTGVFPSNYVDALTTSPPQEPTWSSDPAVLAETSAQESKRQNYIHEMINTEITYMDDMSVVLDVFYKPLLEGNGMTEEELAAIFVNWKELIVCNTKLSKSMKVRKKLCGKGQVIRVIGDILCENLPHLTPYIRFCSCQLNAAALLQHKTENAPEFKELHKKCVTDPRTKGMPLSSFLLKPMQRITKYPLMIGKILQYTPVGHPDHQNLTDALSKAEELCSQVNEGVRERENSDRLEWIFSHVQCDGLPEKITFNSVTNCLGPRKLLYSGTLYKNKSNKELVGFLFNDFLMLTVPLTSSTSVFVFDPKAKAQYKMYKSPIFLNEVMVKKSADEDSETCQFQLSHVDRVFNLRSTNQTERDAWCKKIESASRHYLETEKRKREKTHQSVTKANIVGRLLVIIAEGINLAPSQDVRHTGGVGRLLVLILEACHLQPSDDNGKSDPFCEVSMGVQEHKTKVINSTLNPKWNQSMQFTIRDVEQDVLCITVFDRDLFSPNDFLGRTEIYIKEIMDENNTTKGPITKRLLLHEVSSGEVLVKLDLQLYDKDT